MTVMRVQFALIDDSEEQWCCWHKCKAEMLTGYGDGDGDGDGDGNEGMSDKLCTAVDERRRIGAPLQRIGSG